MASTSAPNTSKRSPKSEALESEVENGDNSSGGDTTNGKRMKRDDSGVVLPEEGDFLETLSASTNAEPSVEVIPNPDESDREMAKPDPGRNESDCVVISGDNSPTESCGNSLIESSESSPTETGATAAPSVQRNSNIHKKFLPRRRRKVTHLESLDTPKLPLMHYDPTPKTPFPKHRWNVTQSVLARQYGFSSKYSPDLFRYNCYGSLHMVERLELMAKMKKHDGCVNALHFNTYGTKLVSGSDDLHVVIWDWFTAYPVLEYRSGHHANVFQAKFMPLSNDVYIVTCARDGQIRLGELSSDGVCKGTRKLAQHKGSAHKLALQMDSPHCFLTCGEDAAVFAVDLREEKHDKIVVCKSNEKKMPLYSIFTNPQKPYEFAVSGRSRYVKVYDRRLISSANNNSLRDLCPSHLVKDNKVNVTSLVYSYNGQEILASYNDENIYTFDAKEADSTKFSHQFKGHRNNQTVKGVNYFGPRSEYVMSGSDCGSIFFWEKESGHIVNYMYADEGGAVNCLEPCPTMPILATSGLDDDIKIWVPSCENGPDLSKLKMHTARNMKDREEERSRPYANHTFVDQTIWFLMQHLSRTQRTRLQADDTSDSPDTADSSSSSSDDVDVSDMTSSQCSQS